MDPVVEQKRIASARTARARVFTTVQVEYTDVGCRLLARATSHMRMMVFGFRPRGGVRSVIRGVGRRVFRHLHRLEPEGIL